MQKSIKQLTAYKRVFVPFMLFRLNYFENLLSDMEGQGWQLKMVRFGCLLYFAPCKPKDNVLYYLTLAISYRGNTDWVNQKSLEDSRNGRIRKKNEFLRFSLKGMGSLKFMIYRFLEQDGFVVQAKENRQKERRIYLLSLVLYIVGNVATVSAVIILLNYIL